LVSWRSRLTVGDVVGAALVVLIKASKYHTSSLSYMSIVERVVLIVERSIN
jgi:hypothetical protein